MRLLGWDYMPGAPADCAVLFGTVKRDGTLIVKKELHGAEAEKYLLTHQQELEKFMRKCRERPPKQSRARGREERD